MEDMWHELIRFIGNPFYEDGIIYPPPTNLVKITGTRFKHTRRSPEAISRNLERIEESLSMEKVSPELRGRLNYAMQTTKLLIDA
jgi:hypothetical protein